MIFTPERETVCALRHNLHGSDLGPYRPWVNVLTNYPEQMAQSSAGIPTAKVAHWQATFRQLQNVASRTKVGLVSFTIETRRG